MTNADSTQPGSHWNRYWRSGQLAACLQQGNAGNYKPEIRSAWESFFDQFPDGARLLDIGTGNGAIALIAEETAAAAGRRFEIHAIDRADINPLRFVRAAPAALARIRFHGHTRAESLPFPEAYFDGISGQYALEYTNLPAAVPELRRVAQQSAHLRFILHAEDAVPVLGAARDLQDMALLLKELRLLDKGRAAMRAAFAFESAPAYSAQLEIAAREARRIYMDAARLADAHYSQAESKAIFAEVLGSMRRAWERRCTLTLDYILKGIDAIEVEIRAHKARLEDLQQAALSRTAAERLVEQFHGCGFCNVALGEWRLVGDTRIWGWELTVRPDS